MKKGLQSSKIILGAVIALLAFSLRAKAQVCEWQLANVLYSNVDPDGVGPATGSVTFDLRIHTTGGTINNVNIISVGWCWQTAKAMVPAPPGCPIVSNPANVTMLPPFSTAAFTFTTVNQCNAFSQTTGGQTFDRRVTGTVDGPGINLTTTWVDVFRVTLWSLGSTTPQAGFTVINSSNGGLPSPFGTYSVSDALANEYVTNSLTYSTPLALGTPVVAPVLFTKFNGNCNDKGTLLTWTTASEQNSSKFEIQKSKNGIEWLAIDNVSAAGNSASERNYQYFDLQGGAAYYRIRQVDLDGKSIYTTIKQTSCENKNFTVYIYPLPAKENLSVLIKSDKLINTNLLIMDLNGKLLQRIPTQINNGNNNIRIDIRNLAGGQYMLTSSNPDVKINKKFVVAR